MSAYRIERSESQNIAEAAGRTPQPLAELIEDHRALFRADLYIARLTTETPPVHTDPQTGVRSADPMSRLGPTLSYPLMAYIGESYGRIFPWARALKALRQNCRRSHTRGHLEREEWNGSLCHALVVYVVIREYAFERAMFDLYLTPERAERILRGALRFMEDKLDALRAADEGWTYRPDGLRPEAHRHHVPGPPEAPSETHISECHHPECVARRPAA